MRKTNTNIYVMLYTILFYIGNMKHCPESLCFLFHKTKCETAYFSVLFDAREIYPGFYLDMIITPIYEVIAAG